MLKNMRKQLKNEKGLTLVELLAVIVILAIVSAIAVPAIGNIIDNSRLNAAKAEAINAINAANIYFVDTPKKEEVTLKTLVDGGYLEGNTKLPYTNDADGKVEIEETTNTKLITTEAFKYGTNDKEVKFTKASIKDIDESELKAKEIGTTAGVIPTP